MTSRPEAGAAGLGGVEGLQHARERRVVGAVARVRHADAHFRTRRLDVHGQGALPFRRLAFHGLDGVHHEIQQGLVQLDGVGQHAREPGGPLEPGGDAGMAQPRPQEGEHVGGDLARIDLFRRRRLLAHEPMRAKDDLARAPRVAGNGLEGLADLACIAGREEAQGRLGVGGDGRKRLVHFVRERGAQGRDRAHARGVRQRVLELVLAFAREVQFGHVRLRAHVVRHLALRIVDGGDAQQVPERRAVLAVVEDLALEDPAARERDRDLPDGVAVGAGALDEAAVGAQDLGGGIADQPLEGGAHVDDRRFRIGGVGDDDAVVGHVECRGLEPFLGGGHSRGRRCPRGGPGTGTAAFRHGRAPSRHRCAGARCPAPTPGGPPSR